MTTENTSSSRRSAATQAAVDRYAADPAAKMARSLALAAAHGLTSADARVIVIARDCASEDTPIIGMTFAVASQSQHGVTHSVVYDPATDSAQCDCLAGVNGLPCGHAGVALAHAGALMVGDAILRDQRAARAAAAAAWHAALDAYDAREAQRRAETAMPFQRNRSQCPFSLLKSDQDW